MVVKADTSGTSAGRVVHHRALTAVSNFGRDRLFYIDIACSILSQTCLFAWSLVIFCTFWASPWYLGVL